MKALQIVTAVIEAGAGVALLAVPSTSADLLLGTPIETPAALTVARLGGAGLLGLGVASWLACDDTQSSAGRGLTVAMLLYNFAAVVVLAYAGVGFGMHGALLWPAAVLHAVMGAWCVNSLRRKTMSGRLDCSWLK